MTRREKCPRASCRKRFMRRLYYRPTHGSLTPTGWICHPEDHGCGAIKLDDGSTATIEA